MLGKYILQWWWQVVGKRGRHQWGGCLANSSTGD